jgi:hypothetical protein
VSIQNALLYTTSQGERRIRVATVCLPVTSSLSDLFKFADVDAVVALTSKMGTRDAPLCVSCVCVCCGESLHSLTRPLVVSWSGMRWYTAVEKVLMTKLSDARQAVLHKCIDILSVYR